MVTYKAIDLNGLFKKMYGDVVSNLIPDIGNYTFSFGLIVRYSSFRGFSYEYNGKFVTRQEAKQILAKHKTKLGSLF